MTGWWAVAFVVQWVLLVVLAVVVVALARQVGTLHLRLGPRGALEIDTEGPELGGAPPPVAATAADGSRVMVGGPGPRRIVLFSSPTCGVCKEVAPVIGPAAAAARFAAVVVHDPALERAWDIPGTPFVVVFDGVGVVRAKGTVNNLEQVEGLLDSATRRMEEDAHEWAS
jgi:thiol-disulfide isomerase/thioredoxin